MIILLYYFFRVLKMVNYEAVQALEKSSMIHDSMNITWSSGLGSDHLAQNVPGPHLAPKRKR